MAIPCYFFYIDTCLLLLLQINVSALLTLIIKSAAIKCLIRIVGRMGSRSGLAVSGMGRVS